MTGVITHITFRADILSVRALFFLMPHQWDFRTRLFALECFVFLLRLKRASISKTFGCFLGENLVNSWTEWIDLTRGWYSEINLKFRRYRWTEIPTYDLVKKMGKLKEKVVKIKLTGARWRQKGKYIWDALTAHHAPRSRKLTSERGKLTGEGWREEVEKGRKVDHFPALVIFFLLLSTMRSQVHLTECIH